MLFSFLALLPAVADETGNFATAIRFPGGSAAGAASGRWRNSVKCGILAFVLIDNFFYWDADAEKEARCAGFGVGQWALGFLYRMVSG